MDQVIDMLSTPLMQRGLLAALLVGIVAPVMGTFLVQRRLSLLGDGIGHVALTGVALGWLVGAAVGASPSDALAVPGAVVAAVAGAVGIEIVRERGRTSADVALALLFYGGIAGGVIIIQLAGGQSSNLMAYLFGSISVVTTWDLVLTATLALVVLTLGVGLRPALFTVSHDEEFARASGLPVRVLNIAIAVMAALTVTVAMRVVGLLLVSALMIVPVAVAQLLTRSFVTTMRLAIGIGVLACLSGLSVTYWWNVSPGAMIVVITIGAYVLTALVHPFLRRGRTRRDPHPDLPADVVMED
ncbi:metal ABC transporter permease [Sanguibacter sp. A247]|uniref:metal ABC transporter permease n=1 Tax=unclassified Sanguibacter TaxID=2645534 RepID=UPI003FD88F29